MSVTGHQRPKRDSVNPSTQTRQEPNQDHDCDYQELQQVIDHYERLLAEQERRIQPQSTSSAENGTLSSRFRQLLHRVIDIG